MFPSTGIPSVLSLELPIKLRETNHWHVPHPLPTRSSNRLQSTSRHLGRVQPRPVLREIIHLSLLRGANNGLRARLLLLRLRLRLHLRIKPPKRNAPPITTRHGTPHRRAVIHALVGRLGGHAGPRVNIRRVSSVWRCSSGHGRQRRRRRGLARLVGSRSSSSSAGLDDDPCYQARDDGDDCDAADGASDDGADWGGVFARWLSGCGSGRGRGSRSGSGGGCR